MFAKDHSCKVGQKNRCRLAWFEKYSQTISELKQSLQNKKKITK